MKKVVSTKPKAVALIRVSTRKQAIKGDQDVQLNKCQAYAEKEGWDLTVFKITETSTVDEREEFNKIIDYCTNSKNSVKYFLIYNISRFTRQGSDVYFELRSRLENAGVKLKDVDGKIQETRNTFEDLNLEYNFSKESPSEKQETAEANEAKSESKKALQTMMRYETEYVRMGFWTRKSLYGFQNVKIDTDKGERTIMIEMPSEANIMRTIFNMLAQGIDENTIVQKANSMGFKSRITKLRDKANMKKWLVTEEGNL